MRSKSSAASPNAPQFSVDDITYWLIILILTAIPLSFSTAVYHMYSTPRFALLLILTSVLLALLMGAVVNRRQRRSEIQRALTSKLVLFVSLYLIVISVSSFFGVSPYAMLFGTTYNRMGLVTYICFFVVFISVIVHTATNHHRFRQTLWAITLTGLAVATYAFLQFFGRDPFVQPQSYTFNSEAGRLLRVTSTLGHSNYLANFLLYVTPLAIGMAFTSRGQARRFGILSAALSGLAVLLSGTRGAWLGLFIGLLFFLVMGMSGSNVVSNRRQLVRAGGIAVLVLVIVSAIVFLNPASRTIIQRARSLVQDTTGSGRTILWRDSAKMMGDFVLIGCGPEGFRKAFLAYKSVDLARLAPNVNNESSHNAYIDAALSFGLPGLILYSSIIASAFLLLLRANRIARDSSARLVIVSLMSSLVAVAVHNFFIFDQISTGLYFFVFVGLAQSVSYGVQAAKHPDEAKVEGAISKGGDLSSETPIPRFLKLIFLFASLLLFSGAAWYSVGLVRADNEITKAITSAYAGDLDGLLRHGNVAVYESGLTGDYHFLFARTLTLYADLSTGNRDNSARPGAPGTDISNVANLAIAETEASLPHTLTPDSSYLLLSYLAGLLKKPDDMLGYAREAIRCDPHSSNTHLMMAEAYLAKGELESANIEAKRALELGGTSSNAARAIIKKTRSGAEVAEIIQKSLRAAESLREAGKLQDARRKLLRALRLSKDDCPECHKTLALICEAEKLYGDAITEWQIYARQSPSDALAEGTNSRIEQLRQMSTGKAAQ